MTTFFVCIDADRKDELYSDISEEFLSIVLLEAIINVVKNPNESFDIIDDPAFYCDHPESEFADSVLYLLDVLTERARQDGVLKDDEAYDENSPEHAVVCYKLSESMAALQAGNNPLDLMMIQQVLENPSNSQHTAFTSYHLKGFSKESKSRVFFDVVDNSLFAMSI